MKPSPSGWRIGVALTAGGGFGLAADIASAFALVPGVTEPGPVWLRWVAVACLAAMAAGGTLLVLASFGEREL